VPSVERAAVLLAALASLAAVGLDSRALAIVAVALAGAVLVRSAWGAVRSAARPLAPLLAPVRQFGRSVARPFARLAAWVGARMEALRDGLTDALLGLDARLGEPVGKLARRVPDRVRTILLTVPRFNAWLAIVIATLAGLALAVVLVSGWLGALLEGRTRPIAVEALYAGAASTAAVAVLIVGFWVGRFGHVVLLRNWRSRFSLTVALVVVLAGIAALSTPEVPLELDLAGEQGKVEGARPADVLLALDPAGGAGRELAAYVRDNREALAAPRARALPFDVALGLATPADPALGLGLGAWTVLEPPTPNRRHFLDTVAAVPPGPEGSPAAVYGSLLARVGDPAFLQWRSGARRAVALVLAKLPAEVSLEPPPGVRLLVFTKERRQERVDRWRRRLEAAGGRLVGYEAIGPDLFADVEDAATGSPTSAVMALARTYSPQLRFDAAEQFFPVDVDDLLAKAGPDGGHRVCDHERFADDCRPADDWRDLLGDLDEYIDFEGGARLGRDLVDRDVKLNVGRTIYVDAIPDGDRLHLAYWWFLRYNVSPWRPERNCLPGFTFAEATCFDHEGDWEGVTVSLRRAEPSWELDSVSFAAHSNVTRWDAGDVELGGDGGTHPVVYVAQGSHAAYPTRCTASCTQKLAGPGLPEGHFGGQNDWGFNTSACCLPLPVTPDRRGALWNAFPGRWGKAVCTAFVKVCSQSDGPRSPSRQGRFRTPAGRTFPGQRDVLARHKARYG
jgi:hypothetical protein